jgi:DNA polymerase V
LGSTSYVDTLYFLEFLLNQVLINGITLLKNYDKASELKVVIRELVDEVTARARRDGMAGKTISVGIGYSRDVNGGFSLSMSIDTPTNFEDEMYQACEKIFDQYYQPGTPTLSPYHCT